jgi:hypothetical protein
MKTEPKPSKTTTPKPAPQRLRDDPQFQGHYNAILTGLFSSSFGPIDWPAFEEPDPAFDELVNRASRLVAIAYHGACYAHYRAFVAEDHSDEEIAEFNATINLNGDEQ